jgi:hypothetical protein
MFKPKDAFHRHLQQFGDFTKIPGPANAKMLHWFAGTGFESMNACFDRLNTSETAPIAIRCKSLGSDARHGDLSEMTASVTQSAEAWRGNGHSK